MGYHSKVVIAVHKRVLAESLITGLGIPEGLEQADSIVETDIAKYWHFYDCKWYSTNPYVAEIEGWLMELGEMDTIELPGGFFSAPYGALRLGEDSSDVEEWGSPYSYGIEFVRNIAVNPLKSGEQDAPFTVR